MRSIVFICLDLSQEADWASSSSIASRILISSHWRSYEVKTGLPSLISNKIVSLEFEGKVLKNFVLLFVDINQKKTLYIIAKFLKCETHHLEYAHQASSFRCHGTRKVNTEVWIAIEENWYVMRIDINHGQQ